LAGPEASSANERAPSSHSAPDESGILGEESKLKQLFAKCFGVLVARVAEVYKNRIIMARDQGGFPTKIQSGA
jgi:hypothetical protein